MLLGSSMWYESGSIKTSLAGTDVYPVCLSHIFFRSQVVHVGSFGEFSTTDIAFTGIVAGTETSLVYTGHTFPDRIPANVFSPRIWAKKKIDQLYVRWRDEDQPGSVREQIVDMCLIYDLPLPFTQQEWLRARAEDEFIEDFHVKIHSENDESTICLHWTFRGDPSRILRLEIYRALLNGIPFQRVVILTASSTDFVDVTADPRAGHRYRLDLILQDGERLYYERTYQPPGVLLYGLAQNYPNPFSTTTRIIFALPHGPGHTVLQIRNTLGQEVRRLIDEEKMPGYYSIPWDGTDNRGQRVGDGIYLCVLKTRYFNAIRKMTLTR